MQANDNINNSPWANRIKLYHTSLQEFESPVEEYDFIILNPPFFQNSLKAPDELRTIARHSDRLSQENIIFFCKKHLSQNGKLAIIYPTDLAIEFMNISYKNGLFCNRLCRVKPNPSKVPHRILIEFSLAVTDKKQITLESEITIETGVRHHYTNEYKELTKDFYMHFKY